MSAVTKRGLPRQRVANGAPMSERIELHTDRSGDHWLWTAHIGIGGYGRLTVGGKLLYAHRVSYETYVGPIPEGMQLDHLCRVTQCVKPSHLEPVTAQTNVRRGTSPGAKALRRENCLHGHPYAEHGMVVSGRRICGLCKRTYLRLRKQVPYAEAMRRKREGIPVVDLAAYFAEQEQAA